LQYSYAKGYGRFLEQPLVFITSFAVLIAAEPIGLLRQIPK